MNTEAKIVKNVLRIFQKAHNKNTKKMTLLTKEKQ